MQQQQRKLSAGRLHFLYRIHFEDARRERVFISSLGFFAAFAAARLVTHSIRAHIGPFHNVSAGGLHVHHLVFGITLLLVTGYMWLLQVGTGGEPGSGGGRGARLSTVTALLFGIGAALTLDEFALWLNLADVYWERQGRQSVDAVALFGSLLVAGIAAGPFIRAVGRDVAWVLKRARPGQT